MSVRNVPANQVGAVVQTFVDNGAGRVVAQREAGVTTYTVGEPMPAPPAEGITGLGPATSASARPVKTRARKVAKKRKARRR
ncbi:MAG TPA: hypothetical protein VH475_21385 [Tepidisphaeraceae bacterium]|jgi:hypothetical protein